MKSSRPCTPGPPGGRPSAITETRSRGNVADEELSFASSSAANGIEPVTDMCPFMALPNAGWFHRAHALLRRAAYRRVK
jgi:hypothetical protein